ncbi:hypothetical protein V8E54_005892 [Elaphomyces granulatus]
MPVHMKRSEPLVDAVPKILGVECRSASILPAESGMDRTDPKLLQAAVPGLGLKAERHSLKQKSTSWCCMKKGPSYLAALFGTSTSSSHFFSSSSCRAWISRMIFHNDDVDDDTTGDLDSPSYRPLATAKKRSYCREFKTALLERRRSFSRHIYDIEKLSFALSYVVEPGYLTFAEGIKIDDDAIFVQNDPFCDDPDIEEFLGYTGNEGTTSHDLEREVPLHHPEMSGRYH